MGYLVFGYLPGSRCRQTSGCGWEQPKLWEPNYGQPNYFFQVSFNVTVRLNTGFPGLESFVSTQK